MFKKFFAVILTCIMAISLFTGCGSGKQTGKNDQLEGTPTTKEEKKEESTQVDIDGPVTISILCAYASEDPHGQYIYQYADDYMKEHDNVTIEITAISSNDIYTKLAAMASSPKDLPTLFFTSVDQAPSLYDIGLMENLNNYLDDSFINSLANGVADACTLDDTFAFFPIDVQPSAVIYRKDRFDEAGLEVPKTWDDFLKCAQELTIDSDGDGNIDQWGLSMVGSNNSSGQSRFMSYLWSTGCSIVEQDDASQEWKSTINDDSFVKEFAFWTDLNNVHGVVPTGITEVDYAVAANYFAMGYTNMILSGSNAMGVAYANNPDLVGKLGSFPIPGTHPGTMLNAEGYALCNAASDVEKEVAVDFLKFFLANDEELNFWQTSGKIPSTLEGQKAKYITGDDYKGYLETIEAGCIDTVNFAGMGGLKGLLGDAYSVVFSGSKTNEEAIKGLRENLETLLEDYN